MICGRYRLYLICLRLPGQGHFPYLGSDGGGPHSVDEVSFAENHRTWHAAAAEDGMDAAGLATAGNGAASASLVGTLGEIPDETSLAAEGYPGSFDYHAAAYCEACVAGRGVAWARSSGALVRWGNLPTAAEPSYVLPFARR